MLRAGLIINPAHPLFIVERVYLAVEYLSASVIRLREECGKFHRDGIEQLRIDPVVDKGSLQRNGASGIAGCGRKGCKVARKHCRCWNETSKILRILAERCALITSEEKEFVLQYRSAAGAAELVALQRAVLLLAGYGIHSCEIRRGIEQIVANKFEQIPVKCIRARLGHRTHLRSPSLLRRLSADFCFELGQRIGKWKRQSQTVVRINMANPIQGVVRSGADTTCRRNRQPRPTEAVSTGWRYLLRRAAEQYEFLHVTAVQRQFYDSRSFHDLTDADAARLH